MTNEKLIEMGQEFRGESDQYAGLIVELADALEAAEKALGEATVTPTDADEVISEREALRIAELDARQAAYRQDCTDWFVDHEQEPGITTNAFFRGWDAAVDGGFRRTEVPEPSAECPQCHRADGQHKLGCGERFGAEPQGEPSDAQVCEILRQALRERGEGSVYSDTLSRYLTRALRAAMSLREGGVR